MSVLYMALASSLQSIGRSFVKALDAKSATPTTKDILAGLFFLEVPYLFSLFLVTSVLLCLLTLHIAYLLLLQAFHFCSYLFESAGFFFRSLHGQLLGCLQCFTIPEKSSLQDYTPSSNQHMYKYQSLARTKSIRLLQITKTVRRGVVLEMVPVDLDVAPSFRCVSYTWGDLPLDHAIVIDGQLIPISAVVRQLIANLASYEYRKLVWIDAVCINQNDAAEKSHQVQLMRDIFHKAESVLIWLGELPSPYDQQVRSCQKISFRRQPDILDFCFNSLPFELLLWNCRQKIDDKRLCEMIYNTVLGHTFWYRCWIIQEITVSSKLQVLCGSLSTSWDQLVKFVGDIQHQDEMRNDGERKYAGPRHPEGIKQILLLEDIRQGFGEDDDVWDLAGILRKCAHFKATDQRDRVYALLSLVRKRERDLVIPDYSDRNAPWYVSSLITLRNLLDPV
jgi:hypothetical protein